MEDTLRWSVLHDGAARYMQVLIEEQAMQIMNEQNGIGGGEGEGELECSGMDLAFVCTYLSHQRY
jgi:hypothetical protein